MEPLSSTRLNLLVIKPSNGLLITVCANLEFGPSSFLNHGSAWPCHIPPVNVSVVCGQDWQDKGKGKKVGVFLKALRHRPVWINISSHVTFLSGHTFLQWCSVNQSVQDHKSQHWMLDWELWQSYFPSCYLVKFDIWLPCPLLVLLVKVPRRVWLCVCVCVYVGGVFTTRADMTIRECLPQ